MRKLQARLTYANVTATLALFLALGGGAYAAIDLVGRNDIKSKHIAPNQVRAADTSDRLRLECPDSTRFVEGACLETNERAATTRASAHDACDAIGRRLPSVAELLSGRREGITLGGGIGGSEWTNDIADVSPNVQISTVNTIGQHGAALASNSAISFRCVARPKR